MFLPLPWLRTLFSDQNASTVANLSQEVAKRCLGLAVEASSHAANRDEAYLRGYVRAHLADAIRQEVSRIAPPERVRAEVIAEATNRLLDMTIQAGVRLRAQNKDFAAAA